MSDSKKTVTVSIPWSDYEMFVNNYPDCFHSFVRRSVSRAVTDKVFFESVFFGPAYNQVE